MCVLRIGAGLVILPAMALLAVTGAFPNRLAAQTLAKLDLPTVVVFAPRPDARSEKPRDSCADPFEFRPVAKRLVSHGDDRDSQAEQRISSCGIRGDALGSGVLGIAVVLNSELCLLPIEVAKEIASIERLLLCCVERDEAVQRRLGESHSADFAGERKSERNFRFGRRRWSVEHVIERPSCGFDPVCPLVFANDRAELFARGDGIALKESSACLAVDGICCAQFAP